MKKIISILLTASMLAGSAAMPFAAIAAETVTTASRASEAAKTGTLTVTVYNEDEGGLYTDERTSFMITGSPDQTMSYGMGGSTFLCSVKPSESNPFVLNDIDIISNTNYTIIDSGSPDYDGFNYRIDYERSDRTFKFTDNPNQDLSIYMKKNYFVVNSDKSVTAATHGQDIFDNMQAVMSQTLELINSDDFKALATADRISKAKELMKSLSDDELIADYAFDAEKNVMSFTYKCGTITGQLRPAVFEDEHKQLRQGETTEAKEEVSYKIVKLPDKVEYKVGESISLNGIQVEVKKGNEEPIVYTYPDVAFNYQSNIPKAPSVILHSDFRSVKADAATDVSLWDKFIRYDLCITDYNSLTSEEKELCHFIFDTEQAAGDNIICERARRTLAGDTELGERITLDNLEGIYGIWDKYYPNSIYGWQIYTHCVPDVIHLGNDREIAPFWYEYWLDDTGSEYVVFNEKTTPDNYRCFDVYNNGELLETITAADHEMPFKDIRDDEELMKEKGLIQQDGGWYYTKPDGTAVFVWCDYAETVQVMGQMYDVDAAPIEEPFVVADEINGCPVTAIESGAFRKSPVTKVVLPDTIEYIGKSAFFNCIYLNDIQLPKGLKYLGNSAFMYCTSLEDLDMDCPALRLDPDIFDGCDALKSMKLNVREIGERSVPRNLESLELGDAVRKIGYDSFGNCKKLETLEIPLGTEQICQRASMYSGIKSVTIPPTVKVIGAYPAKTRTEFMSGMNDVPGRRPLTDEPICAFNADCVVYGYTGSEAERYAEEWGLEFVPLEYTEGDANFDGKFNIADAVSLQSYLLGRQEKGLVYWKAADLCEDNRLDVFDMCLMRGALINRSDVAERDEYSIAGKIFAYEKEGAGGYCTLSFNENGRFLYSPGKVSSYMDGGDWKIDGDTVSLIGMENKTIYLKITDDTLVYIAEGSDEFPYMDIKDGEKFGIYRPEISSDKFQLNSRYSEYGLGNPKVELNLIVGELPEFCYVENVRLYDENDNFIGTMSPAMDADVWSYLVDCNITEECSKTYYTLTKIRCGQKTYLDDVRSEITVNFKVTPAP